MKGARTIRLLVPALFASILFTACAPGPPPVTYEEPPVEESMLVPQDESFNPLTVVDDAIVLPESKLKEAPPETTQKDEEQQEEPSVNMVEVPGYRIQLLATDAEFEARAVEEKALIEFDENVYLIFDSPIYKVRVGDCVSRLEANELRRKAVKLGYRDAWVVQSRVLVTESR